MANEFIKATKVVSTDLAVLEREVVLPGLVWRDAGGDFRGVKDDTISIRVPAFVDARTRVMRSGTTITVDEVEETKVDLTLDTHVYKAIGVTDENMTLDIVSFVDQIQRPALTAVVRKVEDTLATEMTAATYETEMDLDADDPYVSIVRARKALNDARVPMSGRFLAVGSSVEASILESDRLSKFDQSGDNAALRDASMGRIAGFTAVSVPGLDPDVAIAGHRTAFVLSMQAPVVPDGAAWGASESYNGMALRVLKDYDMVNVKDRLLTDVFIGTATTKDNGTLNDDGIFTPDADESAILVRAVKLTLADS